MSSFFQTLPDIIVQFIHIVHYLTDNYIQINYFIIWALPKGTGYLFQSFFGKNQNKDFLVYP